VELVEVAFEGEFFRRPDAFQAGDELAGPTVAFGVVEPPLADGGELYENTISSIVFSSG